MSVIHVEHVLVVPTQLFHDLGYFQGFNRDVDRYFQPLLHAEQVSYRPRPEMEQDPDFKQLIPYVLFQYQDPRGADQPVSVHARHRPRRATVASEAECWDRWPYFVGRCHGRQRVRGGDATRAGRGG